MSEDTPEPPERPKTRWKLLNQFAQLISLPGNISPGWGSGALGVTEFRRFWFGMIISNIGSWMQMIAQGWLVLELTDSPFYLGLVGLVRAIPALSFTLIGGALADRIDRRKLLIITQAASAIIALALAILDITGLVEVWHVMVLAFFAALIMSVDNPTRQALVPDLVGRDRIASAIGLNSAAWNSASIVGPSIAGILVAFAGTAGAFFINAISFTAVLYVAITMKPLTQRTHGKQTLLQTLTEGLRFIRGDRKIWGIMAIMAIPTFFGRPISQLMPAFARDVLDTGPQGYGVLMAAMGIGALAGALSVGVLGNTRFNRGLLFLIIIGIFGGSLLIFSYSSWFVPSLFLLLFVGATQTLFMAMANTLLQMNVSEEMRGRVMSGYVLIPMGLMPLGSMALGSVAELLGTASSFAIGAAIVVVFTVIAFRIFPDIQKMN